MNNKERDVGYYMKQPYNAILSKKNDVFYLYIPELSLIAEDKNLNTAYEKLELAKRAYFKNAVEINTESEIEPPAAVKIRIKKDMASSLAPFFLKAGIIFLIGFIFLNLTAGIVKYAIYEIRGMPYRIINKINNMPEAEVQRKKLLIRSAAQKLKPFIDEVRIIFEENPKDEK